jgi:hypothetical protein
MVQKKQRQENELDKSKLVIQNTLSVSSSMKYNITIRITQPLQSGGTTVEDVPAIRGVTPKGQCNSLGDTQHALERLDALDISSHNQSTDDAPNAVLTAGIRGPAGDGVRDAPNSRKGAKPVVTHVDSGTKSPTKRNESNTVEIRTSARDNVGKVRYAVNLSNYTLQSVPVPRFADDKFALMQRAIREGGGREIACNLLVWITGRYRFLVGIPIEDPFNGQLIPQSPDEYDLTEDDYLEALGIERLYAALLHADTSPDHLVHLAHALGRAAKETNILSDSKPGMPLEPLPPITLPGPITSHMGIASSPSDHDETADDICDDDDGLVSDTGRTAEESAPPTNDEDLNAGEFAANAYEDTGYMSADLESASGIAELQVLHSLNDRTSRDEAHIEDHMNIDTLNATADWMVTDAASGGDSAEDNGNLREGADGDGKRKRTDSLALSPSKVLLLSLDKTTMNLTNASYQAHNEGGRKRSRPLSSPPGTPSPVAAVM